MVLPLPETVAVEQIGARLATAADRVESAKAAYDLALEQRNSAIVEAVDAGMVQSQIARRANVSQPHIVRVCARSQS